MSYEGSRHLSYHALSLAQEKKGQQLSPRCLPQFLAILRPAVAKVYIVSFRSLDDRRPSNFIVLADNMKSAIEMAWEHGGLTSESRFDKSTAQAEQMKEGALRAL